MTAPIPDIWKEYEEAFSFEFRGDSETDEPERLFVGHHAFEAFMSIRSKLILPYDLIMDMRPDTLYVSARLTFESYQTTWDQFDIYHCDDVTITAEVNAHNPGVRIMDDQGKWSEYLFWHEIEGSAGRKDLIEDASIAIARWHADWMKEIDQYRKDIARWAQEEP